MKKILLMLFLFFSVLTTVAQSLTKIKNDYKRDPSKNWTQYLSRDEKGRLVDSVNGGKVDPLSPGAFDRFVTDQFTYTILGSPTPATGLKFETANPSVTLKGNILSDKSRSFITSLELSAGAVDGLGEVFSKDKISNYFKVNLGLNFLLNCNWANFPADNKRTFAEYRRQSALTYERLVSTQDTLQLLHILTTDAFFSSPNWDNLENEYFKKYPCAEKTEAAVANLKLITSGLLKLSGLSTPTGLNEQLGRYADAWEKSDANPEPKEALLKKYNKLNTLKDKFVDSLYSFEIGKVDKYWGAKSVKWLNFSPTAANTNFVMYNSESLLIENKSSFTYGAQLSYNLLIKYSEKHRYIYLSTGLAALKVNTLEDLNKYTYKKSSKIAVANPNESLTTEETGTGYEGVFTEGFGYNAFINSYIVPFKQSAVPGLYSEFKFSHGKPWVIKDKLSVSLGLVWNVNSSDKESKNLLTVVPYVKWRSILNREPITTSLNVTPPDNFSIGIMVGIPINLGK